MKRVKPWITGCAIVVLAACGGTGVQQRSPERPVDVAEPNAPRAAKPRAPGAGGYTVQRGDTLYSISFSLGVDWRELADANGIEAPYTIYPGQQLRVGRHAAAPPVARDTSAPVQVIATGTPPPPIAPVSSRPESPAQSPAPVRGVEPAPAAPVVAAAPTVKPAPAPTARDTVPASPAPASAPKPAPAVAAAPVAPAAPAATTSRAPASSTAAAPGPLPPGAWMWPSNGALLRGYSVGGSQPNKGVDLAGARGDPVYAARSGTVVYAGNGVRGYGNLLIVKHDADFLSAYAHNSKLLVKEGDAVTRGQRIAEIGDSGSDRVKLHFEVRKRGTPVNPVTVLPKR